MDWYQKKPLVLIIALVWLSCDNVKQKEVIAGRHFAESTDAFVILDLQDDGVAIRYNSHMGGQFESTGKWKVIDDQVHVVYRESTSNWEAKVPISDTSRIAIDWKTESLQFFKKANKGTQMAEEVNNLVLSVLDKLQTHQSNQ